MAVAFRLARVAAGLAAVRERAAAARRAQEVTRVAEEAAARHGVTGAELARWRDHERAEAARETVRERAGARLTETLVRSARPCSGGGARSGSSSGSASARSSVTRRRRSAPRRT